MAVRSRSVLMVCLHSLLVAQAVARDIFPPRDLTIRTPQNHMRKALNYLLGTYGPPWYVSVFPKILRILHSYHHFTSTPESRRILSSVISLLDLLILPTLWRRRRRRLRPCHDSPSPFSCLLSHLVGSEVSLSLSCTPWRSTRSFVTEVGIPTPARSLTWSSTWTCS